MVRPVEVERKERHSADPKSSVRAPAKKQGGGGKYTMGRAGEEGSGDVDRSDPRSDPNFDPDEKKVDPEDGAAYTFDELSEYYHGKFAKKAIAEYWNMECTPPPRRRSSRQKNTAGPSVQDSVGNVLRARAQKSRGKRLDSEDMTVDSSLAKQVASAIPHYPYNGFEKFYDIQGLLQKPRLFNTMCNVLAKRYRKAGVTKLVAFESRGFLLAPVSIKLSVPFVMLRKEGKMPNAVSSGGEHPVFVQKGCIGKDDKVVLVDDIINTGETLSESIKLIKACGGWVYECGCIIEVKASEGRKKCLDAGAKNVWGFITEESFEEVDTDEKTA